MSTWMYQRVCLALACVGVIALAGCSSTPQNRGASGGRMDPASDSPAEYGTLDLKSQDLVTATDDMVIQIANDNRIQAAPYPVDIVMDRVVNATASQPKTMMNGTSARSTSAAP